jgi:dTDP-4-amino-4,6-dideoxygalactose transaminase
VKAFEEEFSRDLVESLPVVAVNSGTSGQHLGLLASGIGPGDEVIVPSFTFAATANAVVLTGATPVFCDIDPETFCLDPSMAKELVTAKTRAIMPVHLFGHPAEMSALVGLANSAGLSIFEDAAQAHGAEIEGKKVGTFGVFAMFSLYPTKNMTSGEGGMVACVSDEIARGVRLLRNQGMEKQYENEVIGYNNRMTDIHAAIGRVQLTRLHAWTEKRRRNAAFLSSRLQGVEVPIEQFGFKHVYHQYTIRVGDDRDGFAKALKEEHGVGCGVYYPIPSHQLASLKRFAKDRDLPNTELAAGQVLSLPVHPFLSTRELGKIVRAVNALAKAGG